MTKRDATLGFVLACLSAVVPATASEIPEQSTPVRVVIVDEAHVPRGILDDAVAEASRIFRAAGVQLLWADAEEDDAPPALIVKIVKTSLGGSNAGRALAIAPKAKDRVGRHVWIFYRRIEDLAKVLTVSRGVLLGVVLAHEIGHLLLPHNSHSGFGLMRRSWDSDDVQKAMQGLLKFSETEAALLRSKRHQPALQLTN
jgi:hypothetical protein